MVDSPKEESDIHELEIFLQSHPGLLSLVRILLEFETNKLQLELWNSRTFDDSLPIDERIAFLEMVLRSKLFLGYDPCLDRFQDDQAGECAYLEEQLRKSGFEPQIQTFDGLIKVTHGRILALLGELGHEVEGAVLDMVLQTFHKDSVFGGHGGHD